MSQIHPEPHPLAGKTVVLNDDAKDPASGTVVPGVEFEVMDYWDRLNGGSWMFANGNMAAVKYGFRCGMAGLPADDEVVYGKIGSGTFRFGHLVHVSELGPVLKSGDDAATFTPPSET